PPTVSAQGETGWHDHHLARLHRPFTARTGADGAVERCHREALHAPERRACRLWCRGGRWPSSGPTTGRTLVFRPRHGRQATLRPLRDNARIPVRTTRRCPRSMGGGCGIRTRGGGCPHTISNRAPSATRPILRGKGYRKADGGCRRGREAGALHRLTPERCSTPVLRLRAQVRDEPVAGEGGHLFQRAPLLEQ